MEKAEALRQSILRKAFSGKLVAQDPNDEPASILMVWRASRACGTSRALASIVFAATCGRTRSRVVSTILIPVAVDLPRTVPGITFMLAGATQRSDSDPYDKTSPPITVGPHAAESNVSEFLKPRLKLSEKYDIVGTERYPGGSSGVPVARNCIVDRFCKPRSL
jgi:hypothetical protein